MTSKQKIFAVDGLPPLRHDGKVVSFFEFWPTWVMYLPVVVQWLLLAIRYRSLTLPLLANPELTLAGMVGVAKSELMTTATDKCEAAILCWSKQLVSDLPADTQATNWINDVASKNIHLPFVCKPDIGCRGSGVKLVQTQQQLAEIISSYPAGSPLLCQKLASWEPEAGVFFVRQPDAKSGQVVSLTLKYNPYVIGDGVLTLQQLIELDPRACNLKPLYYQRHIENWERVLTKGEKFRLVFSASHCRGAIFRDAKDSITPELEQAINQIMIGLPDFNYGRLDIKFENIEQLKNGKTIEIVEINGASSESIHIWDRNASLIEAIKTLLWQYRTLFKLGAHQRNRGYSTPGIRMLVSHWLKERRLSKFYPLTD